MTVMELMEILEQFDEDAEIRIASQPSWPFENTVSYAYSATDEGEVVYLAEGAQIGYLPGYIKDKLIGNGWG